MPATNDNGLFARKIAFVTGAGTGIGRAAALAFAREGASVVVADVSEQGNQETARMIEEAGGRALSGTRWSSMAAKRCSHAVVAAKGAAIRSTRSGGSVGWVGVPHGVEFDG